MLIPSENVCQFFLRIYSSKDQINLTFHPNQIMEESMQIPVIKTELAGALTALGKLVSRTSLIKAYQGIMIEGKVRQEEVSMVMVESRR